MNIENTLLPRQALDSLTAAVSASLRTEGEDGAHVDIIATGVRIALDDARNALAVTDPRFKHAHELAIGDCVAFDPARFDTISTLEELQRRGADGLEWPELTVDVDMTWWLKGQRLRTDRTYVVRGPA